jgi:hypothetical protein
MSMMPHFPFHCGISNGGLMWALDCATEWVVGPLVENSSHQEMVRTFQVKDQIWFAEVPLAWFRAEAKGNAGGVGLLERLRPLRATQSIALRSVEEGPEDYWEVAARLAARHGHEALVDFYAVVTGRMEHHFETMSQGAGWLRMIKALAVRLLVPDPLGGYWKA